MINLTVKGKTAVAATKIVGAALDNGAVRGIKDVFQHWPGFLRGSAIGTLVGIIPGVGGAAANFVSYTVAMQSSSHPETFGTGEIEGLIASESANNAKDGGSLIPTLGFGIPGSAETAVLLGAFILHGLIPGPLLIRDHPEVVWALIWGLVVANLVASGLGLAAARFLCKLANVNLSYIIPVVVIFSIMGSYAVRGSFFDVLVAVLFGVFGFFMRRTGFPVITMVIGFILGSLAEKAFMQSLMISGGDYSIFVTRPISLVLFVLLIAVLLIPVFRRYAGKKS